MGQRSTDTSAFSLRTSHFRPSNRIGEEGDGFKFAMATLDGTRPGTAIGAVGVAQAAFEHACEYSKQRFTFEQPIAMHQGVNFLIADMATTIEASRPAPAVGDRHPLPQQRLRPLDATGHQVHVGRVPYAARNFPARSAPVT